MDAIRRFRNKYHRELVTVLVLSLVALTSFAIGYRFGSRGERTPIIIDTYVGSI